MSLKKRLLEAIYGNDKLTRSEKIKLSKSVLMKEETRLIENIKPTCNEDCRKLYEISGDANNYINCLEQLNRK